MKKFGSEPDLRHSKGMETQDRLRGKKKYKAPPPPIEMVNFVIRPVLYIKKLVGKPVLCVKKPVFGRV